LSTVSLGICSETFDVAFIPRLVKVVPPRTSSRSNMATEPLHRGVHQVIQAVCMINALTPTRTY
jgi:hypothetical protein